MQSGKDNSNLYTVYCVDNGGGRRFRYQFLFFDKNLVFTGYLVEPLFWSTFDSWFPGIVLSASGPLAPHDSHFVMQGFVTWVFSWSSYL